MTTTKTSESPESRVRRLEHELTAARRDLEAACDDGRVDDVVALRRAVQVDMPWALAEARSAATDLRFADIDAELAELQSRKDPAMQALVEAKAVADEANAICQTAAEKVTNTQTGIVDLSTERARLTLERDQMMARAEAERRAALRRLAGIDDAPAAIDISPQSDHLGDLIEAMH
jgi:chromosome segregation ATPase